MDRHAAVTHRSGEHDGVHLAIEVAAELRMLNWDANDNAPRSTCLLKELQRGSIIPPRPELQLRWSKVEEHFRIASRFADLQIIIIITTIIISY
jgi:hypothetical protein